jgi:hypothetical protein
MIRVRPLPAVAAVLALCLLAAGCKAKVTKANYEKINNGMTLQDVEAILGRGDKETDGSGVAAQFGVDLQGAGATRSSVEAYRWESGNKTIQVFFVGGKVINKKSEGI